MSTPESPALSNGVVDHFFRHESGKVVAHLARVFGNAHIEEIEDAVQDALYKAMQTWPFGQVPENPGGWIMRVAKNRVIDILRHEARNSWIGDDNQLVGSTQYNEEVLLDHEVHDDQLRMFFACCDPDLSVEVQVMLTLKLLGGFGTREIARALLKGEEAVTKAITRGKARLRESGVNTDLSSPALITQRLDAVLRVLYLMFNEGYKASEGAELVRKDVCIEAMRLCSLLLENKICSQPQVHALLALMCYQSSRLDARTAADGTLLTLEQQNRNEWNIALIESGNRHLQIAAVAESHSTYYVQAAMAACHSNAASYENTSWERILALYDLLLESTASPVVALNRIVAYAKVHGAAAGLQQLAVLANLKQLENYHLLYAIRADLFETVGNISAAMANLEQAVSLVSNDTERSFLAGKLVRLQEG